MRRLVLVLVLVLVLGSILALAITGCGSGASKQLSFAIGLDTAEYIVLDLASGKAETRLALDDLGTNAAYKTTHMVFRRIPGGTATLGQAGGTWGQQADEAPAPVTLPGYYIGVFEVTQAQWQRLAGSTPWTAVAAQVPGAAGGSAPACNLSYDLVVAALAARPQLALPTPAQWEYACRAGAGTIYAWGDDPLDAGLHAAVRETTIAAPGIRTVGSLAANAFMLHDMHGNVWELTADGAIRGGSWKDGAIQARAANRVAVESFVRHALVGCRLVMTP